MSRSALSLATSRLSRVISACSAFCWPWPGKSCCGSEPNSFTHRRSTVPFTSRSRDACAIVTPRSVTSFTASSLNSRVNLRRSIAHLRFHKTPISVSTKPAAAHPRSQPDWFKKRMEIANLFSPTQPVREADLFVGRTHQIQQVTEGILQAGQHAVVYGERGV